MTPTVDQIIAWVAQAFGDHKLLFERSLSFHDDAVHAIVGVGIQVLAALVLRSSLDRVLPLVAVALLAIGNEVLDVAYDVWPRPAMQLGEAAKDVGLTLFLPVVLFAIARWAPRLLVSRAAREHEPSPLPNKSGADIDGESGGEPADGGPGKVADG